ncbi:MAG: IPT/TIG domain-containing protein [Polyangiaceae bacterium]|nr:IPT/TIG domain-containing protein [Polyangiaceae bacterium]
MLGRIVRLGLLGAVVTGLVPIACIASSPTGIRRETDEVGGGGSTTFDPGQGGGQSSTFDVGNDDPHATIGCEPSHGPFLGGGRVLVRGKGFGADVRVWFGDVEVDPSSLVLVDETRVQVTAPPGKTGPVEVATQNGSDDSTRRVLPAGYVYDGIYAVPAEGPTSGGTKIQIVGQDTKFDDTTIVRIDNKLCAHVVVQSETTVSCTVPGGTPGAKTLSVKTGDSDPIIVLDGYTYEDSDNGFKGGLDGSPLAGKLKVLAFDNYTGEAIPGAIAIVGTDVNTALISYSDETGVILFDDPSVVAPQTVTVTAECHSPTTFVNIPVDTMTVYLDPVLTPACASQGDPPPVGGKGAYQGYVTGELVWEGGVEFKKAPWTNVPSAIGANEVAAAYVFSANTDPTGLFQLPAESFRVTEESPGGVGYEFGVPIAAGNRTLYAYAGIEDRTVYPPKFTAYAMGVVKGVPVVPNELTANVYISMTKTLDQVLTLDIDGPTPGPKGPDRLRATVSVQLGNDGYALLPFGQKTPLLPFEGQLPFVGVPSLDAQLYGSTFYVTARAATGQAATAPLSVVSRLLATSTAEPIAVNGFVGAPILNTPVVNDVWDGRHLSAQYGPGTAVQMSVYDITSSNGLIHWLIAAPLGDHDIEVPDLSSFVADNGALPPGPVVISLTGARYDNLDYSKLRYRHLRPVGMAAYAVDTFPAHIEP